MSSFPENGEFHSLKEKKCTQWAYAYGFLFVVMPSIEIECSQCTSTCDFESLKVIESKFMPHVRTSTHSDVERNKEEVES